MTTMKHVPVVTGAQDLLTALRGRTRDLHTSAERHPVQAALVRGAATKELYIAYLTQLAHLHSTIEAELAARLGDPILAPVHPSQFRAGLIHRDLQDLGASAPAAPVGAIVRFRSRLGSLPREDLLGMHYVLEGSTNGGRFIARAVRTALELPGDVATRYLDPYGAEQNARWESFCAALSALALSGPEIQGVVRGAEAMFRLIIETFDGIVSAHPAGQ